MSKIDYDFYQFYVEPLEKAASDMKIDASVLAPIYIKDAKLARYNWSKVYTKAGSAEREISYAVYISFNVGNIGNFMTTIRGAYGYSLTSDHIEEYSKMTDKYVCLMDYLLIYACERLVVDSQ